MEEEKDKKNKDNRLSNFARFSGIAFQMGATIYLCAYAGKKLDAYYQTEKKWFTMGLILFGVTASIYLVVKQLNKMNRSDDS